jgi:SAM-dependent methyltransferase
LKAPLVFDADHYGRLNAARGAVVTDVVADLRKSISLRTAIDVGCGVGYFSGLLQSNDFRVTAVDGRAENVEEAKRRHHGVQFHRFNAEDSQLLELGTFDLCFCFGLLYHLENPLQTIRLLRALTKTLLLVEGVIFPGTEPIMALIDEEPLEDQGLRHVAFYPTEACLIKMFYRAGFPFVYWLTSQPKHSEYNSSPDGRRIRTMLAASLVAVESAKLRLMPEPSSHIRPWDSSSGIKGPQTVLRLRRFAEKTFSEKIESLKRVVKKPKQK